MSDKPKKQLLINALPECEPEIGRWLGALEDTRQRTRDALDGIQESVVDWQPDAHNHTIGTLLYHIAAIEVSWLGIEVMEGKLPVGIWDMFPYEVRDDQGRLTIVRGISYTAHWERLDRVRKLLLDCYKSMPLDEYRRVRSLEPYDVTPEWVLHHLCQHEAEHRSEIAAIRAAAEKYLNLK